MKKFNLKAFSIIISILMLVSFSALGTSSSELKKGWITLSDVDSKAPSQTEVSAIRGPGMMLDFTLPGFTFNKVTHNGQSFDQIIFPDQSSLEDNFLGAPNVPMLRHAIGIIEGAELSVTITDVDYVEFTDINLEPLQRALLETETLKDREFEFNKDIYSKDAFFPENWAEAAAVGSYHGVEIGEVELFPVSYNPVQKTLRVAKSLSLTVEFLGERADSTPSTISPHLTKNLKAMLLNFDIMQYPMTRAAYGNDNAVDYLILVDPQFANSESINRFADHYRSRGMNVEVKDVSTIGTSAKKIRAYIKQVYDSLPTPELDYVLLASDIKKIPFGKASGYNSDIWYAWVDKNDKYADVGLGRFPAKNEQQMKWMVDKSINFNNNIAPGEWRNKSILVSHKEQFPNKYTQCKREIFNTHQNNVMLEKMEGGDTKKKWSNQDVIQKINEGVLIVNYRGHGSADTWLPWNQQNQAFTVNHAAQFKNGNRTPIVFSIACTNTDFTHPKNTIAEAFVVQKEGAVAYLGATKPSLTITNHDFDKALYNAVYIEKIETIGEIYNYANGIIYKKDKNNKNVNLYLWVGDPALSLVPKENNNKVTLKVSIEGNGRVNPNGGTYDKGASVTLTAIPDANAKFIGWSGDASGAGTTTTITMDRNSHVIAKFSGTNPPPGGIIASDDFETFGWNGGKGWLGSWKKTKSVKKAKLKPASGKKYVKLSGKNAKLERSIDLSNANNVILKFAARIKGFEADDKAFVRVSSNGVSYTDVMSFGFENSNNQYQTYSIPLKTPKTTKVQIVFEGAMNQADDKLFIDSVEVIDQ